ncbi:MAG TPA: 1-phosphofructokinase family hexose kinase [Aquabacterium sp.]|nr:1-phosphofructokinase family hexose kinase [Aquabacterium sp.]
MPDIVTFTMNPALDVSTDVQRVEPTHKMRCGAPRQHAGGGGINVARVIHRLGGSCIAFYPSGGATGQVLQTLLTAEGVPQHVHPIQGETRESFSVRETQTGQEYRFVLPGPTLQDSDWQCAVDWLRQLTPSPRYVVASGSLAPGVPTDFYARLATLAKKGGARFVIDSTGEPLKLALNTGVFLYKPSLRELQELTGRSLESAADQVAAARVLINSGEVEVLALSLGERGALLVTRDQAWQAAPLAVPVMSAIGAGDSFVGGMLWALNDSHDLPTAFAYGVAAASAALLHPGTHLCQQSDVMALQHRVQIQMV